MAKNDMRKGLMYGLIMLLCVVLIVIVGKLCQDNTSKEYEEQISSHQNKLVALNEENRLLQEENKKLTEENTELKEKLSKSMTLESDVVTMGQAQSDLKDIYDKFKEGKVEEAKAAFEKIEPMGYDDVTLAYYEILKDILEN